MNFEPRIADPTPGLADENQPAHLESLLARLSHDLRSPVLTINGFTQVLLEDYEQQLDEAGKDYLQILRRATERINLLIQDMDKQRHKARWLEPNQTAFGFY